MSQNRIAEPVEVRVTVVATAGVQAPTTSNTASAPLVTVTTLGMAAPAAVPSLQVGDPILASKQ